MTQQDDLACAVNGLREEIANLRAGQRADRAEIDKLRAQIGDRDEAIERLIAQLSGAGSAAGQEEGRRRGHLRVIAGGAGGLVAAVVLRAKTHVAGTAAVLGTGAAMSAGVVYGVVPQVADRPPAAAPWRPSRHPGIPPLPSSTDAANALTPSPRPAPRHARRPSPLPAPALTGTTQPATPQPSSTAQPSSSPTPPAAAPSPSSPANADEDTRPAGRHHRTAASLPSAPDTPSPVYSGMRSGPGPVPTRAGKLPHVHAGPPRPHLAVPRQHQAPHLELPGVLSPGHAGQR